MIDIEIKDNKNNLQKLDNLFYDLLVILKDMNVGSNFDNNFILELFKFAKNIGYMNLNEEFSIYIKTRKLIGLYKEGKYKEYKYNFFILVMLFTKMLFFFLIMVSKSLYI
jgi:hypothetical protein